MPRVTVAQFSWFPSNKTRKQRSAVKLPVRPKPLHKPSLGWLEVVDFSPVQVWPSTCNYSQASVGRPRSDLPPALRPQHLVPRLSSRARTAGHTTLQGDAVHVCPIATVRPVRSQHSPGDRFQCGVMGRSCFLVRSGDYILSRPDGDLQGKSLVSSHYDAN
jgi:hypothetical protein